jgi:hypothetical protein
VIGSIRDLTRNMDGSYNLTVTVKDDCRSLVDQLKDTAIDVEIKKHRHRRSLDANAFCWALCSDIGKAMKPPLPKEEVYRNAIRGLGKYDLYLSKEESAEAFSSAWSKIGTGWFCEKAGESKEHPGFVWLFAYRGTSCYDSKEMGILLDGLVDDAEQMGLQIQLGKKEIERLKNDWRMSA